MTTTSRSRPQDAFFLDRCFPQALVTVSRHSDRETLIRLVETALERGWITASAAGRAQFCIANGRFSIRRTAVLCCSGAIDPVKRRAEFAALLQTVTESVPCA